MKRVRRSYCTQVDNIIFAHFEIVLDFLSQHLEEYTEIYYTDSDSNFIDFIIVIFLYLTPISIAS